MYTAALVHSVETPLGSIVSCANLWSKSILVSEKSRVLQEPLVQHQSLSQEEYLMPEPRIEELMDELLEQSNRNLRE
ncbi:hypothetical protein HUB98_15045 [Paenibacillus barcinonensis]|uniref:Uncharacterized protein n=1 Tax=Paenibacillus barcinonensis TaxID=198119 RepID=A0A2V4VDH5_PAEBA|nr:hypothetical protein [Paenibacillus barcinonensis]PYE50819.1 hypothetical protein DFQ00_103238 [Paenibacillus barcinonensis]QKS57491.1 hypothetical protein HUB98_15045 [Paenibacillus barcinonensis]